MRWEDKAEDQKIPFQKLSRDRAELDMPSVRRSPVRHSWRFTRPSSPAPAIHHRKQPPAATATTRKDHRLLLRSNARARVTEVALFDYASRAEDCLKYRAWILYDVDCERNFDGCVAKFEARFSVA